MATSAQDIAAAAERFDAPVALKPIAPDRVHKSQDGGVLLNVSGTTAAKAACEQLLAQASDDTRILVTPMPPGGIEIIIGGSRDRQFGPVVMGGLGGVGIEALDDVSFRPAPVAQEEAHEMFADLKSWKLFHGGAIADGLAAVTGLVSQISILPASRPEIAEIDLNPVILSNTGPVIADALIVLT